MILINGITASDEDLRVFLEWYSLKKIAVLFYREGSNFINVLTN